MADAPRPTPFEHAIVQWITQLPGTWSRIDWEKMSSVQQDALNRLVAGGFIECRGTICWQVTGANHYHEVEVEAFGDIGPRYRETVERLLKTADLFDRKNKLKKRVTHGLFWEQIRLTSDGESARQAILNPPMLAADFALITGGPGGMFGCNPRGRMIVTSDLLKNGPMPSTGPSQTNAPQSPARERPEPNSRPDGPLAGGITSLPKDTPLDGSHGAVFINYAHQDNEGQTPQTRWLDRLLQMLKPLVRQEEFSCWSDKDIKAGDDWHQKIQSQLEIAKAAILLVSPAFLASDYIANSELPVLLMNAKRRGTTIIPLIISPCHFEEAKFKYPDPKKGPDVVSLATIQGINSPSQTLIDMTEAEQNRALIAVGKQLISLLGKPRDIADPAKPTE